MADYRTLENKIRDIVARPWTKDPKAVHHKQQQIQKKIIDEEPDMLNNKAIGIPDSVIEAAKSIAKGKTEVDVNPQYKPDIKDPDDDDDKKVKKEELKGKQHKIDKNKNGKIDAHDFKLLRKEEVEQIDELDRDGGSIINRYIRKTTDNPKRKAGRDLALKKKWGDKNYGTDEPKVKAVAREEVEQIDEKEVVFTGSPQHTAKKAAEHKKMGYKVVSMKKHTSGSFGDNSEKHTYKMTKEEAEQVDEISDTTLKSYRTKAMQHRMGHEPGDSAEVKADRNRKTRNRTQGVRTSYNKIIGRYVKVGGDNKKTYEEVSISVEEQAKLDAIAATFAEDAVQSAQKSAQQKMKAASITAKATVQADKIKDQARKQAQNNSYQPEGDMVEEGNLAAQIRDAKPSVTGHIEVSVGDKKVKIPHRKAQDFLGSYHAKRTPAEKDDHEKAFRKEIGG
jgi:hypothetical protein